MDSLAKAIALVVLILLAFPVFAQDTRVAVTLASQQSQSGIDQNRNTIYQVISSNGVVPTTKVGDLVTHGGGVAPNVVRVTPRLFGWQPMTAGFWYRKLVVDTSVTPAEVLIVFPWTRAVVEISVGTENEFVVGITLDQTYVTFPNSEYSLFNTGNPSEAPWFYHKVDFGIDEDAEDVGGNGFSDTYLHTYVIGVTTAGFIGGGTAGTDINNGGAGPGEGELPNGADFSFTNENDGEITGGGSGWQFGLDIKQMDLIMDSGGRDYIASVSDGFNGSYFVANWDFTWYINSSFKPIADAVMLGFAAWWAVLLPINALKKR